MKLTWRGMAACALISALILASLLFRDFLIEASLVVVLVVVLAEAGWVALATFKPETKFRLEREGRSDSRVILRPGQESLENVDLKKKVGGTAELRGRINFLDIKPKKVHGPGDFAIEFRFNTQYSGEYSCEELEVSVAGPVGLFSSAATIPFALKYVVYPRVLRVAAAAVRLLALAEIGETPIDLPGVGSEYYEMRSYLPGDDVRNVNWKASAREGELIVVEHMKEVGSHILLVLDTRAQGYDEADRLASTFLSIANSLWAAGIDFGVLVHDGVRVTEFSSEEDQRRSLRSALRAAVSFTKLEASPEFLELVPMRSSKSMKFDLGSSDLFTELAEVQNLASRSALEGADPWNTAAEYVRSSQTGSIVYVSSLTGNVQSLIELAWESRHYRNVEFIVANPCEDATNHAPYQKLARALNAVGVIYFRGEPVDLARRILAA